MVVTAVILLRSVPLVILALQGLHAKVSGATRPGIETTSLAALQPPVRINAGAATAHTSDAGVVWLAGSRIRRGRGGRTPNELPIANTSDPEIYQTERYGMSYFGRDVPNGQYIIYLHFAETFEEITAAGQRVFAINVEGTDIPAFDIIARAGAARTAYVEEVPVEITDGRLDITFAGRVQNAAINGIEIIPEAMTDSNRRRHQRLKSTVVELSPGTDERGRIAPGRGQVYSGGDTASPSRPRKRFRVAAWPSGGL